MGRGDPPPPPGARRRQAPAADGGPAAPGARDPWALDLSGGYGLRLPGNRLINWSASLGRSPAGPRFTLGTEIGAGGTGREVRQDP